MTIKRAKNKAKRYRELRSKASKQLNDNDV